MSRAGPRGSIAMALSFAIMAIGGTAGLVMIVRATQPSQPTPPPPVVAPPPPTTTTTLQANVGPIAFRDPDNTQRWLNLRPRVDAARVAIAALDKASALPIDDLEESCAMIFRDANPLGGEPHKDVQSYADGAKRLCDYDRSLALLRLVVRVQRAAPAPSKSEKRARCDFAAKSSKRLLERGYGDDELVKSVLADVGKACI